MGYKGVCVIRAMSYEGVDCNPSISNIDGHSFATKFPVTVSSSYLNFNSLLLYVYNHPTLLSPTLN